MSCHFPLEAIIAFLRNQLYMCVCVCVCACVACVCVLVWYNLPYLLSESEEWGSRLGFESVQRRWFQSTHMKDLPVG